MHWLGTLFLLSETDNSFSCETQIVMIDFSASFKFCDYEFSSSTIRGLSVSRTSASFFKDLSLATLF